MEKTKNTSVYLEDSQIRYVALMAFRSNFNKSEYIRSLIEDDMERNCEVVKQFEKLIFKQTFK